MFNADLSGEKTGKPPRDTVYSIPDLALDLRSICNVLFSHRFIGNLGRAHMYKEGQWVARPNLITLPILLLIEYPTRNVAGFIIEEGDLVGKPV